MNFKIVKLLLLSIAFLGTLLTTSVLVTSLRSNATSGNLAHKSFTANPAGDPVDGGFPQNMVSVGDPVDGGFPQAKPRL
jgi:hypothetical protein